MTRSRSLLTFFQTLESSSTSGSPKFSSMERGASIALRM